MTVMQTLVVNEYGAYVSKHSARLRVTKDKEVVEEAPLVYLQQVLLGRGASVSSDAILACAERGIAVHVVSNSGRVQATLYAAGLGGTVLTRRAQLLAFTDARGLALAKAFARGKIANQTALLKYLAKARKESDPPLYKELRLRAGEVRDHLAELDGLRRATADDARAALLSIEGRAAQKYWDALKLVIPPAMNWPGRRGRGARDPVNAALNYGYAILQREVERALVLAGLDPFAGFIHADRPGKPSLTLDLMEEFRQVVVDRAVLALIGLGVPLARTEEGWLTDETRRAIAQRVLERLENGTERYEKKRQPLRVILQTQARHIATFVRKERDTYEPFVAGW